MYVKNWVVIITLLILYDIYNDYKYFNKLQEYSKYYKMAGISLVGITIYYILNNSSGLDKLKAFEGFINIIPINKNSPPIDIENFNVTNFKSQQKKSKRCVSEAKKKFVASSQKWLCKDCNELLTASYEIDHIVRLDNGGTNDIENLVALCRNCHGKKTTIENII